MQPLTLDSYVVRKAGLVHSEIDGEVVALDVSAGTCFGLNEVGSRVWQLLDRARAVAEICNCLSSEYAVDRVTLENDVFELLQRLVEERLVEVSAPEVSAGGGLAGDR